MIGIDYTYHSILHNRPTLTRGSGYNGSIDNATHYQGVRALNTTSVGDGLVQIIFRQIEADIYRLNVPCDDEIIEEYDYLLMESDSRESYQEKCSDSWWKHFMHDLPRSWQNYPRQYRIDWRHLICATPKGKFYKHLSLALANDARVCGCAYSWSNTFGKTTLTSLKLWCDLFEVRNHKLNETTLYDLETGLISLKPIR